MYSLLYNKFVLPTCLLLVLWLRGFGTKIHRWFCLSFVVPSSISSIFESFLVPYRKGKVGLKGVLLVWHAAIWVLWHARNDRIRQKNYIDLYASSNISLHSEVNEIFLGGKLNITD
jgi:hypothetical protein